MKHSLRVLAAGVALVTAATGVAVATTTAASAAPTTSTLVEVSAGHHDGFDRLVLQFYGPVPARRVTWVDQVVQDGSGKPVRLAGHAFLNIRLGNTVAHRDGGAPSVRLRRTFATPNITQTALAGDFEGVVTVGVGVQRREAVKIFTLAKPNRLVIDLATPYATTPVGTWFLDRNRYADGTEPYTVRRSRPAIAPAVASQALERLFAGPTVDEWYDGLRFVSSRATGFTDLTIADGIARLRLTGGCASGGSTFTVADEIMPTLKQFASVDHVKIYGPAGYTEAPTGDSDSIPPCLEP